MAVHNFWGNTWIQQILLVAILEFEQIDGFF